ncbi:MAG: hypothetical protein H8D23_09665 [Candidatus Brocadiales bacterium]|nr:hypothetical protein [Candidatus Brocadiales bacterium]
MRYSFDMFPDSSKEVEVVDRTPTDSYPPKIEISPVTGKITQLRISKSLIRQLIYKGDPYPVCPCKVYHTLLLRDVVTPPSDSMIKGLYFESKCLGVSANGQATIDLPRHKKTEAKLVDHDRIDQAVERFNQVKEDYGLIVEQNCVQKYHKRRWIDSQFQWNIPIYLDGTLDLISPIVTSGYSFPEATIDLKLTRDRNVVETFSNGLYHSTPWGNMEQADFTEAMMYRLIFGKPFVYMVFDYKATNGGFRDIPIITDINDPDPQKAAKASKRMAELYQTIRWVFSAIMQWEASGWPMTPIPKVCNSCPIEDCSKRNESMEV